MSKHISRRTFLKLSAASTTVAGSSVYFFNDDIHQFLKNSFKNNIDFFSSEEELSESNNFYPLQISDDKTLQAGDIPTYEATPDEILPLVRYFPELHYSSSNRAKVQIINTYHPDFKQLTNAIGNKTSFHNSLFPLKNNTKRFIIPWAPLFKKHTPVYELKNGLTKSLPLDSLYIKDEGSNRYPLFGNKARKYEFAFPLSLQTRAKKIITFGSLASNHCLYSSLTAATSSVGSCFRRPNPKILVNLYPQQFHPHILGKLKLLLSLGTRIRFLENDNEVGVNILANEVREYFSPDDDFSYLDPGGSNPLTTLAHVNAIFELNEQITQNSCALKSPPDLIFAPLGSGGTCMGLVLGCYLLGWKTKIVGTTSQDKAAWKRTLIFGNPSEPFLVQNGTRLLKNTIELMQFFDLPGKIWNQLKVERILEKNFLFDNDTWHPAYGIPSKFTKTVIKEAKQQNNLILDGTFAGKSFSTLLQYAQKGLLNKKSVLFWNTYQRYNLLANKKVQAHSLDVLPKNLLNYLSPHMGAKSS